MEEEEDTDSQCLTTANSPQNPSSQCLFPFNFDGQEFNECLKDFNTGNFWCPTELEDNGDYIPNEDKWGFCGSSCPPLKVSRRAELPPKIIVETTTDVPLTAKIAEILKNIQARQGNEFILFNPSKKSGIFF